VHNRAAGKIDRPDFRGWIPNAVHPAVDTPNHVQIATKIMTAANLIRSATAPMINAGVMIANIS
jgi:hypothetical protein